MKPECSFGFVQSKSKCVRDPRSLVSALLWAAEGVFKAWRRILGGARARH